jgi:hypothetical protein
MATPKLAPDAWATIFGYEDVEARLADGSVLVVRVRQVRVRQAPHLMGMIEDDFAVLDYTCIGATEPLPEDWTDLLSPAAHRELVKKVRSLNFPVILGVFEDQHEGVEEVGKIAKVMAKAQDLQTSLTKPPSS